MEAFQRQTQCNGQRLQLCPELVQRSVCTVMNAAWEEDLALAGQNVHDAVHGLGWSVNHYKASANHDTYFQGGVEYLTVVRDEAFCMAEKLYAKSQKTAERGVDYTMTPAVSSDTLVVIPEFADHWRLREGTARYNHFLDHEVGLVGGQHFVGTTAMLFLVLETLERLARGVFGEFYPPWRAAYCWKHMICHSPSAKSVIATPMVTRPPRRVSSQGDLCSMCTPRTHEHTSEDDHEDAAESDSIYFSDNE